MGTESGFIYMKTQNKFSPTSTLVNVGSHQSLLCEGDHLRMGVFPKKGTPGASTNEGTNATGNALLFDGIIPGNNNLANFSQI